MIRSSWIVYTRNKLADLVMDFDSHMAIEESKMDTKEREDLKNLLKKAVNYIDSRI